MATVNESITGRKPLSSDTGESAVIAWTPLAAGDTGRAVSGYQDFPERTVHVFGGTFGDSTVTLQGSLDGTNWATLTDPQGNALTFTSARIETIQEVTPYIRPSVSGTTGTGLTVQLYAKRSNQ